VAIRPILLPIGAALLALMGAAAPTGLLVPNAEASLLAKRREDEDSDDPPLLLTPSDDEMGAGLVGHRSHSSHRSHRSHSSHRSHYSGSSFHYSSSGTGTGQTFVAPRPAPPKPAVISLVATPGGRIFLDGKPVGTDATGPLALAPGPHTVRIENRFLGTGVVEVSLDPGQTGVVDVNW
jgi:hypothetical protein